MFDLTQNIELIADVIEIEKDNKDQVGIAIGGGAPTCPCLYIVEILENSPAKKNNRINIGDEIVAVNGEGVRGYEKSAVASLIRQSQGSIKLSINRLQFGCEKAPTLDIILKKFKHRFIDFIDDASADALGLSRAILCNDVLEKLQERLNINQHFYKTLIKKAEEMGSCYKKIAEAENELGNMFSEISAKETDVNEMNYSYLALAHKLLGTEHDILTSKLNEIIKALKCHTGTAIPDVRLNLSRYLDAKYEYLSYCLCAKELEDEEAEFGAAGDRLIRMETGNYEYRAVLKCREQSMTRFIERRKQVAVKTDLLDERHVRELALQLKNLIDETKGMHTICSDELAKFNEK